MPDDDYVVLLSPVGRPEWRSTHWRAELFADDGGDLSRAMGIAYVTAYPPDLAEIMGSPGMVDYMTIFEHDRSGPAPVRALLRAIRARWPGVELTPRLGREEADPTPA